MYFFLLKIALIFSNFCKTVRKFIFHSNRVVLNL
ncbi:hypothetical protein NT07LI_3992, partial [Listeria innocua FSL S4-378]